MAVDCVSTRGDSPETWTLSVSVATPICMLMVAVNPAVSLMPSRVTVANPLSSNTSLYSPGGIDTKRYRPTSSLTCVCTPIIAGPDSVAVTPGSTPPC